MERQQFIERREHPRRPTTLTANVRSNDSTFFAKVNNVSLGGAYLQTPEPANAKKDDLVKIELLDEGAPVIVEDTPIVIDAQVLESRPPSVRVRFTRLSSAQIRFLS